MMQIHTVAAGGGSILHFDGARFRVGPDSAGANPGPASYRRGGPLTVTDCNVMLGPAQSRLLPEASSGPDATAARSRCRGGAKFEALAADVSRASGRHQVSAEEAAEGFLRIAVANMANAIKEISIQRGYDVSKYTLACFGGAGGQHACRVADELGMKRIFPPSLRRRAVGLWHGPRRCARVAPPHHRAQLRPTGVADADTDARRLAQEGKAELLAQGLDESAIEIERQVHIKYSGTDTPLLAEFGDLAAIKTSFEEAHRRRYGFIVPGKALIVDSVSIEAIGKTEAVSRSGAGQGARTGRRRRRRRLSHSGPRARIIRRRCWNARRCAPVRTVAGPAIILEPTSTTIVEPGWTAIATERGHLVLERRAELARAFRHRHRRRSGDAGDLQQPVHVDRRADGLDARKNQLFGEHQGAARLLLRPVRPTGPPDRQRAAHAGASGVDGRIGGDRHPCQSRCHRPIHHHARRCVRAERALQWRHASARRHGHHAGVQ